MGEYTEAIERINIELSLANKLALVERARGVLRPRQPAALARATTRARSPPPSCSRTASSRRSRCCARSARSGAAGSKGSTARRPATARAAASSRCCRTTPARVVEDADPEAASSRSSPAPRSKPIVDECQKIHDEVLRGRVWVALHMHAGDGNVHTNIPVNSDNYEMLQTAHAAVARIMKLARSLDGVISGEHGIGITKLEFLSDDELAAFTDYKQRVDPEGPLQQGQAAARRQLRRPGAEGRPHQRLHAELRPDGARVADHAAERHRRDRDLDQGLPALRQVQAAVHDARAARQPALQPAQQDPRDLAADRGVPVRGADATRRVAAPLGGVRGRRRPLHRLPQVPERRARSTSTSATSR